MNLMINMKPKILLILACLHPGISQCMDFAREASVAKSEPILIPAAIATSVISSSNGSPVPPLSLEKSDKKEECSACRTTENLLQDGCNHFFCKPCREKQGDDGCLYCTKRYENCAICLAEKCIGLKIVQLVCNHKFCGGCMDQWLAKGRHDNKYCPLCKTPAVFKNARCNSCSGDVEKVFLALLVDPCVGLISDTDMVLHNECLIEYVKQGIMVGAERHYRINNKNQFYYICKKGCEHALTDEATDYIRTHLGLPEITKLKRYVKPAPKTPIQSLCAWFGLQSKSSGDPFIEEFKGLV